METMSIAVEMPTLAPAAVGYYRLDDMLTPDERDLRYLVRDFMEREVIPIINPYWENAEFPLELIPKLGRLGIGGGPIKGYGCAGMSYVGMGMVAMELARGDASTSTIFGVQSGLAMGSIYMMGNEEQKQQWLPAMAR